MQYLISVSIVLLQWKLFLFWKPFLFHLHFCFVFFSTTFSLHFREILAKILLFIKKLKIFNERILNSCDLFKCKNFSECLWKKLIKGFIKHKVTQKRKEFKPQSLKSIAWKIFLKWLFARLDISSNTFHEAKVVSFMKFFPPLLAFVFLFVPHFYHM